MAIDSGDRIADAASRAGRASSCLISALLRMACACIALIVAPRAGAGPPVFPGAGPDYHAWVAAQLPGAPEGLAVDEHGIMYATVPKLGLVMRLDGHGGARTVATAPSPELAAHGRVFGAELDHHGHLYVAYVWNYSEDDENDPTHAHCRDARDQFTGIYRVTLDTGTVTPVLTRHDGWPVCFPDDIAIDAQDNLYVTDLTLAGIWKLTPEGRYALWSDHPLLQWPPAPYATIPEGANDLVIDRAGRNLYVATDGDPAIVRIPVNTDGTAGTPVVVARDLSPLDGIELDEDGNIYVSEILRSEISVFSPDGHDRVVIATADTAPLLNPTSLVYHNGVLCTANMGWDVEPEPTTIVCVSGYRRPTAHH